MGNALIRIGLIVAAIGLVLRFGGPLGLGRLPGDLHLRGDTYEMHIPITTCLLISGAVSFVLWLLRRGS